MTLMKSVAIPARFLDPSTLEVRDDLTDEEQAELAANYGHQPMTPEEEAEHLSFLAECAVLQPLEYIKNQIRSLEATISDRRRDEAMPDDAGGTADGRAWMKAIRDEIAALRVQLEQKA